MTLTQTYRAFRFGAGFHLSEQQMRALTTLFERPPQSEGTVLGGRLPVARHHIEGVGDVVVKAYQRGGFMRHLSSRRYLKVGKTRGQREYELLQKVRSLGIRAPEPVVYACKGCLFYSAWLATREIQQPRSLAQLSLQDHDHARRTMKSVIEQIARLIDHEILHVDLHPGNVVVDGADRVFLLDFDKGRPYRRGRQALKDRYYSRWRRAIIKHSLPVMLKDMLSEGLQKI